MKKCLFALIAAILIYLCGCASSQETAQLVCTTLPVFEFTSYLCQGTSLTVTQLVTDSVSCLHDYTLNPKQMRAIEKADAVILSGNGLEDFLEDAIASVNHKIDASESIATHHAHENHEHDHHSDPHIWLSPVNAKIMSENICNELCKLYPEYESIFITNLTALTSDLQMLQDYATEQLQDLSCRNLITFHDGFSYMAEAFDLTIVKAIEEESGSEASALDLIEIISLVDTLDLPAIFTEKNGSTAAAKIISRETGVLCAALDMALSGDSYFDAMYQNINTLREALK